MAANTESPDVNTKKPIFRNIDADDEDQEVTEIESLCFNCYEQGMTRLLLTKIPFFKEVIISSFSCPSCGHMDTSIQPGGTIMEKGVKYTVIIRTAQDLNRQVIKSDAAAIRIPHLEFEQPPAKKGEITTVEGVIDNTLVALEMFQPERKASDPETAAKLEVFLGKLKKLKKLEQPFVIVLDDPSGNSYIENLCAPQKDESLTEVHYKRTHQQNEELGLESDDHADVAEVEEENDVKNEVISFQDNCPNCSSPADVNMKVVDIPFFKEVVIMATNCDACGHRDNDVKGGAGIADKGKLIKLHITDKSDLNRDVLKSDTCAVRVPELELDMAEGTLGGRFSTVEGILTKIKEQLSDNNPMAYGDSAVTDTKKKLKEFCEKLDKVISGETLNIHFVMDDPAGNSYLQNVYAPDPDPEMVIEEYERSYDQKEILGLNDMNTDNYTNEDNTS